MGLGRQANVRQDVCPEQQDKYAYIPARNQHYPIQSERDNGRNYEYPLMHDLEEGLFCSLTHEVQTDDTCRKDAKFFEEQIEEINTTSAQTDQDVADGNPDGATFVPVLRGSDDGVGAPDRFPKFVHIRRGVDHTCRMCGVNVFLWIALPVRIRDEHHLTQERHCPRFADGQFPFGLGNQYYERGADKDEYASRK